MSCRRPGNPIDSSARRVGARASKCARSIIRAAKLSTSRARHSAYNRSLVPSIFRRPVRPAGRLYNCRSCEPLTPCMFRSISSIPRVQDKADFSIAPTPARPTKLSNRSSLIESSRIEPHRARVQTTSRNCAYTTPNIGRFQCAANGILSLHADYLGRRFIITPVAQLCVVDDACRVYRYRRNYFTFRLVFRAHYSLILTSLLVKTTC